MYEEIETVYFESSKLAIRQASFYDNAREVLQVFEKMGKTLAIATSKDEVRTKMVLDQLPVRFSLVQTPNQKMRGKPAPDHLLYILAALNFDPSEAVYIGDMDTDAEAAQRANIDYVHAEWGYGNKTHNYKNSAKNIADLINIL